MFLARLFQGGSYPHAQIQPALGHVRSPFFDRALYNPLLKAAPCLHGKVKPALDDAYVIDRKGRDWRRWLPWLGAAIGLATLAWVLRKFDLDRFLTTLRGAELRFLLILPGAVIAEQAVRAWKWRQLLFPLRPIGTIYLFGAIMAGYLLATLVPFGFGTIARSWLVARRESLKLASVLATVALDRLSDGIVFVCLVPIVLLLVAFPDPGGVRAGLVWGGAGMVLLFAILLAGLIIYRRQASAAALMRLLDRLPARLAAPLKRLSSSFAEGINWPRRWRGGAVILGSIAIKLLAVTQFLWAGLAFGITLEPAQYLFIMVFVGSLVILGHFARVAGSFIIGALFVLSDLRPFSPPV